MKSVLGKFIQREFGKARYECYTDKLEKRESMDIFCDIYENLRYENSDKLNQALKDLLETVQISIQISKNFFKITWGCLLTIVSLLALGLPMIVLYLSLSLTILCYCYKVIEYIANRFCDRDVKIVLIYKIALFHILEESCLQKNEHAI